MNMIFNLLSAAAAALAIGFFGWTYWGTIAPDPIAVASPTAPAVPTPFESLKIDVPRTIDLDLDDAGFDELTERERRDQLLDWLLLAVLSDAGLSAEQLNQATFDLPARRHGALKPVAQFEYGPTRSRALPDGRIVVLRPADVTDVARKDHLAHAFDEQRKNLGELPQGVLVFEYALEQMPHKARLTRRPDVPVGALMGPEYGYLERVVSNLADLTQFMSAVDDLTFAKREGETLRLGGRRLQAQRARGIRAQDVAALWQSEAALAQKRRAFERRWNAEYDALNARVRAWRGSSWERDAAQARFKAEADALDERAAQDRRALGALDHSGFSLDPAVDFEALRPTFEAFALRLAGLGPSGPVMSQLDAVREALARQNVVPLLRLLDGLQRDDNAAVAGLAELMRGAVRLRYSYQAARYDGELSGTEVGMNLFYTDLLAKLWALNYRGSAPKAPIPDFWPLTEVNVSPVYEQEIQELSSTRLWFGHQDQGFQVSAEGQHLLFARNATRVYAASSSPLEPGKESEPNAESERFLGWWNDHFEEVARFEPEYERLNQIMKWSVVIGWLNAGDQARRLGFLGGVEVDRKQWFPDWVRRHPELRFRSWEEVGFFPRGHLGAKTETMPILITSFKKGRGAGTLSGGVSLAPRQLFEKRAALSTAVQPGLRRSGLDYSTVGAEGLRTLGKSSYRFSTGAPGHAGLAATPREGARLRLPSGEVKSSASHRTVAYRPQGLTLDTTVDGRALGRLQIERQANGFNVGWRGRDLDAGQALARRLGSELNMSAALRSDPNVLVMVRLDGQQLAVRMRGQERWLKMAPQSAPSAKMPEGWDVRVADAQARRVMQVRWIDDPRSLVHQFPNDAVVVIERAGPRGPTVLRLEAASAAPGPAGETVTFQRDGMHVSALRSADGASLRVRLGDLRAQWPDDPLALAQRIGAAPPHAPGAATADLPWGATAEGTPLTRALRDKQLTQAARRIALDPAAAARVLDEGLRTGIAAADSFSQQGLALKALSTLDELIALHGPLPDLTLRKALALVQRNRNAAAAEAVTGSTPARLRDPVSLLSEVESRMRQAAHPGTADQISRLHDLARWRERNAASASTTERLSLSAHQERLSLDLHAHTNVLRLEPLTGGELARAHPGNTLIYVQDSPGLNNLDFSVSVQQALAGLPSGRLPRVMHAGNQTIADFRPDRIYLGDPQVAFQLAHKPSGTQAVQGMRSLSSDRCDRYPEAPDCRRESAPGHSGPAVPAAREEARIPAAPPRILIVSAAS